MVSEISNQPVQRLETDTAQTSPEAVADIFAQGFSAEQLTRSVATLRTTRDPVVSVEDLDFIQASMKRAGVAA